MLIAISGSQASGKSTVLKELKALGYPIIERKTARSILDEWGISLESVYADFDLNQAFHEELVRRKYGDEVEATLGSEIVFTERTFEDIFTYALISFGQYNRYDEWLDEYFEKCKAHCQHYDHVFYIKAKFSNNIEKDGVRSFNKHFSRMVDLVMFDNIQRVIDPDKLTSIETLDLDERVSIILDKYKEQ
jgi:predicted ATPase